MPETATLQRSRQIEFPDRKQDHIELAFQSQVSSGADNRFYYEPLLSAHPSKGLSPISFLGKKMKAPLWISSMTGGTAEAYHINQNLARACHDFGLGMGLGSCRKLLEDDTCFKDFNLRPAIGHESPFFANLGIAQLEQAIQNNQLNKVIDLVNKLEADGLIIHVNPLQEWLQPEGDRIIHPPIDTIKRFLEKVNFKVIVKEVGQGMGPESLKALFQLPLAAIDFAAFGGTNFSKLELLRNNDRQEVYHEVCRLGHSAEEMVMMANLSVSELKGKALCPEVIISGGITGFLDGYYLINRINCTAIYGQGSAFLKHARSGYDELREFIERQIKGLEMATAFLRVRKHVAK